VTGSVSKKWLIRLKKRLMKKVTLDWDKVGKASGKATFLVCAKHNSMIGMLTFFIFKGTVARDFPQCCGGPGCLSRIRNFPSRIPDRKDPGSGFASKNFRIFNPKSSRKNDLGCSSQIRIFSIPDPD
jgi:hypothetical protein